MLKLLHELTCQGPGMLKTPRVLGAWAQWLALNRGCKLLKVHKVVRMMVHEICAETGDLHLSAPSSFAPLHGLGAERRGSSNPAPTRNPEGAWCKSVLRRGAWAGPNCRAWRRHGESVSRHRSPFA